MRLGEPVRRGLQAVGIRTKILGMVVALVATLGLAVTLQVRARLRAELSGELEMRGVAVARDLASRAADLILTDRRFALYELVGDTLRNNPDVRYVFIVGSDRRVLVHSFERRVPPNLVGINSVEEGAAQRVRIVQTEEGPITDVAVPVLGGRAGAVRIGLSQQRLRSALGRITWQVVGMTGAALLAGLAVALVLTAILTRPVLELVEIMRAVGNGDLSMRARQTAEDEVGELTSAVNAMIAELARSQEELVRRVRELGALSATTEAVSGDLSLSEALQAALGRVLEVMNVRAGWLLLAEGEGRPLRLVAHAGLSSAFVAAEAGCERHGCVCREVMRVGQAAVVPDLPSRCASVNPDVMRAEGLSCHVSVPVMARESVLGVMNVACHESRPFSPEEMSLLDSVGRQLGLAVENGRLWEEVRRKDALRSQLLSQVIAAQEAERKRIARELHDEAGQLLTTLLLSLRTLEQEASLPSRVARGIVDLKALAKQLFEGIHRLAVELRPNVLDQFGLVGAVESFVRDFAQRTGLNAEFEVSGLDMTRIPGDVEIAVYRIVQEALANVAKHAAAHKVAVLLERRNGALVAVVEDDGGGFEVNGTRTAPGDERPRLGLFGMQERAALVNGRLTIESEPGRGTTVFVEVPLEDRHDSSPAG